MKIKTVSRLIAGAAMCISLTAFPITSHAATPEEAAEIARAYGIPEDFIQQAWNSFYANPEKYPPDVIDDYIEILISMGEDSLSQLTGGSTPPPVPEAPEPQAPQGGSDAPEEGGDNGDDNGENGEEQPPAGNENTLTLPDGSAFDRVSSADFAKMTMEEKQAYYASLTPEQQAVFIRSLSAEDYRSLIKQLPSDQKADILDSVTVITNDLGLSLTVDELTDTNLTLSMKNDKGELIAVGSAKDNVANTGYDRRGILAAAAALVLTGIAGAFVVIKKCFSQETENE